MHMPRKHTIWDSETQTQIDVPFTEEEEKARDREERAAKREHDDNVIAESARHALMNRIGSDSATLQDVLKYLRSRSI